MCQGVPAYVPDSAVKSVADLKKPEVAVFEGHDCCVTPVIGLDEAMDDPQHQSREMFVHARHPVAGDVLQFAPPFKLSRFDFEVERPAPAPGEHADEILDALGYDAGRIAGLRARGVV